MTSLLRLALLGLAAVLTLSCAATTTQDRPVPDPEVGPSGDMCRIYAARSTQMMGRVRTVEVIVNDQTIGRLGESGYLCWDLPVGRTVVQALFHGSVIDGKPVETVFGFDGEGGATYYYELHMDAGTRKAIARALDENAGKALMADRKAPEAR